MVKKGIDKEKINAAMEETYEIANNRKRVLIALELKNILEASVEMLKYDIDITLETTIEIIKIIFGAELSIKINQKNKKVLVYEFHLDDELIAGIEVVTERVVNDKDQTFGEFMKSLGL